MSKKRILLAAGAAIVVALIAVALGWRWWTGHGADADAPLVGVSVDTAWHSRLGLSTTTYETALTRADLRYTKVRPGEDPEDVLDHIDALLLAGGGDIDPRLYGGDPSVGHLVDRERDDFEMALIRGALARDMPILGLCRGVQMLNVAHGGTVRNLRADPVLRLSHGGEVEGQHIHGVHIDTDSALGHILQTGSKRVNSWHGQAVGEVGDDLVAVAWGDEDDVVEAVERPDKSFVMALQWHPEILSLQNPDELAIFEALRDAADDYRQRRAASASDEGE